MCDPYSEKWCKIICWCTTSLCRWQNNEFSLGSLIKQVKVQVAKEHSFLKVSRLQLFVLLRTAYRWTGVCSTLKLTLRGESLSQCNYVQRRLAGQRTRVSWWKSLRSSIWRSQKFLQKVIEIWSSRTTARVSDVETLTSHNRSLHLNKRNWVVLN
jgi:hypothetical protein